MFPSASFIYRDVCRYGTAALLSGDNMEDVFILRFGISRGLFQSFILFK